MMVYVTKSLVEWEDAFGNTMTVDLGEITRLRKDADNRAWITFKGGLTSEIGGPNYAELQAAWREWVLFAEAQFHEPQEITGFSEEELMDQVVERFKAMIPYSQAVCLQVLREEQRDDYKTTTPSL